MRFLHIRCFVAMFASRFPKFTLYNRRIRIPFMHICYFPCACVFLFTSKHRNDLRSRLKCDVFVSFFRASFFLLRKRCFLLTHTSILPMSTFDKMPKRSICIRIRLCSCAYVFLFPRRRVNFDVFVYTSDGCCVFTTFTSFDTNVNVWKHA